MMDKKMLLSAFVLLGISLSANAETSESELLHDASDQKSSQPSTQDDKTESELETIKVSTKKNKDPHTRTELGKLTESTPISGVTVNREELEHLELGNNLLELGKRVPGISMIRNMRIPDGGKLYTENRIDGMRASATNTSVLDEVDLMDLERIDVITGPASALYGSGAFGGTISVFRREPPLEFDAKLSQELGSYGFNRSKGFAGGSLADGRVGIILTASTMDFDGWRKNAAPINNDAAEEHKDGTALRTSIRLTDSTKVDLGYNILKYNYRWAGPIPLHQNTLIVDGNIVNGANALRNTTVYDGTTNIRSVYFDGDWQDTVPGSYGEYDDLYKTASFKLKQLVGESGDLTLAYTRISDDGTNNGNGGSGGANNIICDNTAGNNTNGHVNCATVNLGTPSVTNTIKKSDVVTETTLAMYRQEFDLAKSTAYIGAEKIDVKSDSTTWLNAYTAQQGQSGLWTRGAMTSTGQGNETKTTETTPFVHFEFSPIDYLRLHIGERFGRIDYDVNDRTATNKDVEMTRRGNVKRLGATYDLTDNHLVWVNYGETFNPQSTGSISNQSAVGTANNVIGRALSPERGKTREIGFRGNFESLGLKYDMTYFDADSNGFLVSRDCTTGEEASYNAGAACTIQDAAGQLSLRGLESTFLWAATSWLDLGATYTNSRVWFTDYQTVNANGTLNFDFSGKDYQAAPRQKLNLRLGIKPASGWLVELEGDHIADYYVDNTNGFGKYSRPDLYNLRASYRSKNWSFWMHALNLTDRKYATRVQLSTVGGQRNVLAAQAGQGNAGSYTPLTIRVGASYDF